MIGSADTPVLWIIMIELAVIAGLMIGRGPWR